MPTRGRPAAGSAASGDVLDCLAGLIENSLVAPAADARGEPRFRLYETVRAYAVDLLDDEARAQVESAYVAHLAREAADLSVGILSRDHQRWAEEFRLAWPDLRRAWELAIQRNDAERTSLASMSLMPLWLDGRVLAGVDLVDSSLRLADRMRPPHHGDLVFVCAQSMFSLGAYERAAELLDRIDQDVAPPVHPSLVGAVSLLRGFICVGSADLEAAERELQRAVRQLEVAQDTTADWLEAFAHNGLGSLYAIRDDVEGAISEFTISRRCGRDSGNVAAEMQALVFEADLRLAAGSSDLARDLLDSACELLDLRPLFEGNAYCLEVVAAYAADRGDATAAARLLGLASALRDALGARIWALREPRSTSIDALVRSASDPGEFDAAFAEGRALDPRSGATLSRAALLVGTTSTDAGW